MLVYKHGGMRACSSMADSEATSVAQIDTTSRPCHVCYRHNMIQKYRMERE
jgi:hypothetical protein